MAGTLFKMLLVLLALITTTFSNPVPAPAAEMVSVNTLAAEGLVMDHTRGPVCSQQLP